MNNFLKSDTNKLIYKTERLIDLESELIVTGGKEGVG